MKDSCMDKVSVVIPTLQPGLALKCIESIGQTADLDRFQIIVVATDVEEAIFPDYVEVVHSKERWLPAKAYNEGIKRARGSYVLLLNDDVEFLGYKRRNYWIDLMLEKMNEDSRIGAVGVTWLSDAFGNFEMEFLSKEDKEYGFLVFFCVLFKAEVFATVGLLDERFVCGVDVDFCLRMRRKGYVLSTVESKVPVVGDAYLIGDFPIWHAGEKTVHTVFGEKVWNSMMEKDLQLLRQLYGVVKPGIVIPAWGDCVESLDKCLGSIVDNTCLDGIDVLVLANGCVDAVRQVLYKYRGYVRYVWYDEELGATVAMNRGIAEVKGDVVIILNQDVLILGGDWLSMLLRPFSDSQVGIVGPLLTPAIGEIDAQNVMFFCVAIRREVFERIGMLDEAFSPGGFEDIDFCIRAKEAGWKLVQVPDSTLTYLADKGMFRGQFPIYHVEHHGKWMSKEVYERNYNYFVRKHWKHAAVTAYVLTKGRYETTLPLALMGIVSQSLQVKELLIIDDNEEKLDLSRHAVYQHILGILTRLGISWKVIDGARSVVQNHQLAIKNATYELLWRVDDDNFPMYNVLENCLKVMFARPGVGAVGSLSIVYDVNVSVEDTSGMLKDIWSKLIPQWACFRGVQEVEHLHNSFVYRRRAVQHVLELDLLSPVGHREETIFTAAMHRAGWKLYVVGDVITWHLRQSRGGIRSFDDERMWKHDDEIFAKWVNGGQKIIVLDSGIGDHIEFLKILTLVKERYKDCELIFATCYPEVFEGQGITQISIAQAKELLSPEEYARHNVYRFMSEQKWTGSVKDAYMALYDLGDSHAGSNN